MLEGWGAERQRLRMQAQEQRPRHTLEQEAHTRQETYLRYDLARQWYSEQRRLESRARGLVQLARLGAMEGEWRDRLVQEEGQGRAAQGCSFLLTAEAVDRRGVQGTSTLVPTWCLSGHHTHDRSIYQRYLPDTYPGIYQVPTWCLSGPVPAPPDQYVGVAKEAFKHSLSRTTSENEICMGGSFENSLSKYSHRQ